MKSILKTYKSFSYLFPQKKKEICNFKLGAEVYGDITQIKKKHLRCY